MLCNISDKIYRERINSIIRILYAANSVVNTDDINVIIEELVKKIVGEAETIGANAIFDVIRNADIWAVGIETEQISKGFFVR